MSRIPTHIALARPVTVPPGGPRPPHRCLDRSRSPTNATELDAMRRRAWHQHGVATFTVDEIMDKLLRQAIVNEADRR